MPTLESLGIDKLTTEEKYELIEAIEASIVDQVLHPISDAEHQEIMRRASAAITNPESLITMDAVKAHLSARNL
ncbi:MAG: addiction module protein [Fimbriiglobus sp.]